MVKVSELKDEELLKLQQQNELAAEDDDYDQISDEDDAEIAIVRSRTNYEGVAEDGDDQDQDEEQDGEGLYDRLLALKDIVPYRTRRKVSQTLSRIFSGSWTVAYFGGRFIWSVCTTAFLFGLPALYSQMVDEMYAQMEQQARMQGGGAGALVGSVPAPAMIK